MAKPKTVKNEPFQFEPAVYLNAERRTCIVYHETEHRVHAVAMEAPELVDMSVDRKDFHAEWKPIQGCEVSRAASQYLNCLMVIPSNIKSILERLKMNDNNESILNKPIPKPTAAPAAKPAAPKAAPAKPAAKGATKPAAKAPVKPAPVAKATSKTPAKGNLKEAAAKYNKDVGAKPAAAKGERKGKITPETIVKLVKGSEGKTFQEGSMNGIVFAKVKDGMTVKELVKACAKQCDEKQVYASLAKLANPEQKQVAVTLK